MRRSERYIIINGFGELASNFTNSSVLFIDYNREGIDKHEERIACAKVFISNDCDEAITALLTPLDTQIYIIKTIDSLSYSTKVLKASGRNVHVVDRIDAEFIRSLMWEVEKGCMKKSGSSYYENHTNVNVFYGQITRCGANMDLYSDGGYLMKHE